MTLPIKRSRLILLLAVILMIAAAGGLWWSLDRAQQRARKQNCLSNMVAINLAGRLWATDHGEHFPRTLSGMSNELNTPKVLYCIADPKALALQTKASSWDALDERRYSYEIVNPGISEENTNTVFLRCKKHGHLGYVDGSVFNGERRLNGYEAKFGHPVP